VNYTELVQEFIEHTGAFPSYDVCARLIDEEAREAARAIMYESREQIAKELADVLYVTFGAAAALGIPIEAVFEAVHRSNMTKEGLKDAGGKVMKGEAYEPPDIERVLRSHE
jgi:predicted HAD superfamily Cof-like phosphohydrolase